MTDGSYLQRYRLQYEPFRSDLDDRFFYGGTALMQRLDLLTHLTQFGESIVLVCGPAGSGKTTLLRRFLSHAAAQWRICALKGDAVNRLPELLADALNSEHDPDEARIIQQWASQADSAQLVVLVIDDADQLDEQAVRRLGSLLRKPNGDRIRLLMFGTEALHEQVLRVQAAHGLARSPQLLEIPRLTEEETASYLMYRLAVAGYSGESPFSATEIRGLCKAGDGRPGAINRLAHQALEEIDARAGSHKKTPAMNAGTKHSGLWLGAAATTLAFAIYLGWQRSDQPAVAPGAQQIAGDERPLQLPPADVSVPAEDSDPAVQAAVTVPETASDIASMHTTDHDSRPAADTVTGETSLPLPAMPEHPAETGIATETQADAATRPPADVSDGTAEDLPVQANAADTPATEEPAETVATESTQVQIALTETATPPAAAQQAVSGQQQPAPTGTQPRDSSSEPAAGPHREDWLLAQDPARFSLQLLGSRSEAAVTAFIRENGLDRAQSAYYAGRFKGKPWFVLMYGTYDDRKAALEARNALPAAVRKSKPWPRDYRSVQQAIEEAG